MSYVSDAHRFRKTIAGLCMIGAPILFLVASFIAPASDSDEATAVGLIAADSGAYITSGVLVLFGWALFMCATLGMMHMLREKGASEGHLGGALMFIGTVCAIAQTGFSIALWEAAKVDPASATSLLTAFNDSGVPMAVLFMAPLGVTLGAIVLSWSLYRNHFVAPWMAAAIGISGIAFAAGSLAFSQELFIAASALLLVGMGALGSMVLSESVEEWEHTPEFHGLGLGAH
jgi:hypothetical protein